MQTLIITLQAEFMPPDIQVFFFAQILNLTATTESCSEFNSPKQWLAQNQLPMGNSIRKKKYDTERFCCTHKWATFTEFLNLLSILNVFTLILLQILNLWLKF